MDVKDNPECVKFLQRAVKADKIEHCTIIIGEISFLNVFPVSLILAGIFKNSNNIFGNGAYILSSICLFFADFILDEIMIGIERHYQMKVIMIYNMAK